MTTTNHTPGPWVLDTNQNPPHVMTKDGYAIHDHPDYSSICNADEVLANARLISAAPELLRALENCLRNSEMRRESGVESGPIIDREIERARAAIAKAKGE